MEVIWLGQAGLLFIKDGFKIMIDPYLSDSVKKINQKNYRRVAVDRTFFDIEPDVMIFTHNHLDHYDPETVSRFITADTDMLVLAPSSVWSEVRKIGGGNNYIQFNRHTVWTEKGIKFTAVKAEHSDITPIGVIKNIMSREILFIMRRYLTTFLTIYMPYFCRLTVSETI